MSPLLAATLLFAAQAAAEVSSWTNIGPPGGVYAADIIVDPTSPSTVFALLDPRGVWRSVDGGRSWRPANSGLETVRVTALAADPRTPGTLYAGSSRGIFKSIDGGQTWLSASPSSMAATALAVDPSGRVLAGVGGRVFRSSNGADWGAASEGFGATILRLEIDPAFSDRVFAATYGGGLLRSMDGGVTWTRVLGESAFSNVITVSVSPGGRGTVFASVQSVGFFRSDDGGTTWARTADPPSVAANNVSATEADPVSRETVYVSTSLGIFRTRDGGTTWESLWSGLGA